MALRDDLELLSSLGISKVHLDIMDAGFVPRFGLYPEIVRLLESEFEFEFDAHLMVRDVCSALKEWFKYQIPEKVSYHYSANIDKVNDVNRQIRDAGAEAILAYDLSTTDEEFIESVELYKPDGVMLLGIIPGVLEQQHQPEVVFRRLDLLKKLGASYVRTIQIDGGVNFETASDFITNGATELVCGSSTLYKGIDFADYNVKCERLRSNVDKLKECICNV